MLGGNHQDDVVGGVLVVVGLGVVVVVGLGLGVVGLGLGVVGVCQG